ncbi:MAG: Ig-like domain-containing protein [Isosphaeraceae bacterium]|nr:Ig-like domain-containing protein [Isosphaeraceae bacterium]
MFENSSSRPWASARLRIRPALEILDRRRLLAAFVSVKSGDWFDETVWGGVLGSGIVPKAGDTATISSNQSVRIDRDAVIGDGRPTGSNVLIVNGRLEIDSTASLTVRGDVLASGSTGTNGQIHTSGDLVIDGTASGTKHQVTVGAQHYTSAKLVFSGSPSDRASFRSTGAGTLNAAVVGGSSWFGGGRIEADRTDFVQIGDASRPLTSAWLTNSASSVLRLVDSAFIRGGMVGMTVAAPEASVIEIAHSRWESTASAVSLQIRTGTTPPIGARSVHDNRFDQRVQFFSVNHVSVDHNQFDRGYSITGVQPASWSWNLVHSDAVIGGEQAVVNATNNYIFNDRDFNPHPMSIGTPLDHTLTGNIFDMVYGEVGDLIVGGPRGGPATITVAGNIVLPNAAGRSPGKMVSPLQAGGTWVVEHNTVTSTSAEGPNASSGAAAYGENYEGNPGMYASVRSNLIYSPVGKGSILSRHVQGRVSDPLVDPSMGDYNGANSPVTEAINGVKEVYGPKGGYIDTSTNDRLVPMFTNTTGLGVHDVTAEPEFLDFTRNLATFDTAYLGRVAPDWQPNTSYAVGAIVSAESLGFYAGAEINFRAIAAHTSNASSSLLGKPGEAASWRSFWEFASVDAIRRETSAYDPSTRRATPRDLIEWVALGASPTNPAFQGAAHDGGDIGARPVVLRPTAIDQAIVVVAETLTPIALDAADPNSPASPLTYTLLDGPSHGTLSGSLENPSYEPDAGYTGADSFRYRVTNAFGLSSEATVNIDVVPAAAPEVVDLLVEVGSTWISVFSTARTLPWFGIDSLRFVFSTDVIVEADDLTVEGIDVPSYATSGFAYDSITRTATWTLAQAFDTDIVSLILDGDSLDGVHTPLGLLLGGGADFLRELEVLPGDVDGNGVVDAKDVNDVRNVIIGILPPSVFTDLDGDGVTDATDYDLVRRRTGRRLPARP